MSERVDVNRRRVVRWVRTMPAVFLLLGLGFGTWLSRLPALRDHLGATTLEMSIYGLCLAVGSIVGLVVSGRVVQRFGPKRTLVVTTIAQSVTLPAAIAIILSGAIPVGLVVLFVYGFVFATADIAMNVSGANAERAFGRPRLPLMHAGYSLGTVLAMGLGALAEAFAVPLELHFLTVFAVIAVVIVLLMGNVPGDEQSLRVHDAQPGAHRGADSESQHLPLLDATGPIPIIDSAAGQQPAFSTMTGPITVPTVHSDSHAPARSERGSAEPDHTTVAPHASPWRDPRILLIGLIALSTGLVDGTASDWLPLALVDGRGVANEVGTLMLGIFFASILAVRIAGAPLITRFGRVSVLRASAVLSSLGIVMVITVPGTVGLVLGTIAWGLGSGLGWPIAISAAADRAETAVRNVAAVSALGYGSMLIGPMAFGVLGEWIGLLTAFWALLIFTAIAGVVAYAAREPKFEPSQADKLSR